MSSSRPDFTVLKNKVSESVKVGRKGNNAQTNCGHLTLYALRALEAILAGKEPELKVVNTSNSAPTTMSYAEEGSISIKMEDQTEQKQIGKLSCDSVRTPGIEGLHAFLPPGTKSLIDAESGAETILIDPKSSSVPQSRVDSPDLLNDVLMRRAREENTIISGVIYLVNGSSGHVLAFCASSEEVFYIDGQLYNGSNGRGCPTFESFKEALHSDGKRAYYFSDEPGEEGKSTTFQAACFYTIFNRKPLSKNMTSAPPVSLKEGELMDVDLEAQLETSNQAISYLFQQKASAPPVSRFDWPGLVVGREPTPMQIKSRKVSAYAEWPGLTIFGGGEIPQSSMVFPEKDTKRTMRPS